MATDSSKTALPTPGHLGVVVEDLDKAKEFLSRVLGLAPGRSLTTHRPKMSS